MVEYIIQELHALRALIWVQQNIVVCSSLLSLIKNCTASQRLFEIVLAVRKSQTYKCRQIPCSYEIRSL